MRFDGRLLGVCLLWICASCARMTVSQPPLALDYHGPDDEVDFMSGLFGEPAVSNHDALLGLALYAEMIRPLPVPEDAPTEPDEDQLGDLASSHISSEFDSLTAYAAERGWIDDDDVFVPDQTVRFGVVAVAICDVLQLNESINQRLFPGTQRYCTREVFFQGVTPLRTPAQSISGPEFLEVLRRMEERANIQEPRP